MAEKAKVLPAQAEGACMMLKERDSILLTPVETFEEKREKRVDKVKLAINQLNGEDLSTEEVDHLHGLLLGKMKRPQTGIVFHD